MRVNNYLSVLLFQLKFEITCTSEKDILVTNSDYFAQMEKCIELIKELSPDICIFPEMTFSPEYNEAFLNLSKGEKIIIFGSTYDGNSNFTKVYFDGNLKNILKVYPCGSEPMIRFFENVSTENFIKDYLKNHEYWIKGKKVYILNCLEYYKAAYLIARNHSLSKDLFGFLVPCSNSNPKVFMDESKALHNHNEFIYSFVSNRIKNDGSFGYGLSYIFGPIQSHEKEWLQNEGIVSEKHNSSIITLDKSTPSYCYGEYAIGDIISRFGRSDSYLNTPRNLKLGNLI